MTEDNSAKHPWCLNIGERLKQISYIIVALVNTLVPTLIHYKYLTIDSDFLPITSAITTVALLIASRSPDIERLIVKYGLDRQKLEFRLEDLQSMSSDLQSVKDSLQRLPAITTRSIEMNEPIATDGIPIEEVRNDRIQATYHPSNGLIQLEFFDRTPRTGRSNHSTIRPLEFSPA
jgi:hypothetical protein